MAEKFKMWQSNEWEMRRAGINQDSGGPNNTFIMMSGADAAHGQDNP